jgi:DNA polymerase-3 subunit beta
MEITVTQENLTKALTSIGRVASSKTQLPILNNILLRTDGNRLLVAATNLEIAATQYIGAKITKPGAITVPARLITEFTSNLPKGSVDLKVVNENIHISSGKYKSIINGVIADEFPELPTINEKSSIQYNINIDEFKQAVNQTIIATSTDSSRPVLTGVYWHSHEGDLYLAGTDGYRLAERKMIKTKSNISAIIPTTTLQEVLRVITDETNEVDILFDETQVRFRLNESEIISRLIDGNFPDYRQLVPQKSDTNITLKKEDFVRVIKIASLFARESGGSITITTDKEKGLISVHSIASQLGENTSEVDAEIDTDGQITLNSRYINEALNVIESDGDIEFNFSGKLAPSIIKAKGDAVNYYHVVMPLKS